MTPLVLSTVLSLLLGATSFKTEQSYFASSNQRITYRTYQNGRFDYSIAYPSTLVPQGESDSGDGQVFLSQDGTVELRVWGNHNALEQTLRDAYREAIANVESSGGSVKYKFLGRDFFVVSGTQNGVIIYQKTLFRSDIIKSFRIKYPMASQATYDAITARIARSFKG